MKREQVGAMIPILQAFVDGKEIEGRPKGFSNDFEGWMIIDAISNLDSIEYRIKPELKYRSFKNTEECWQEMQKHQPFGWVKRKENEHYSLITDVDDIRYGISLNERSGFDMNYVWVNYTFVDGTPFGIKVEE